ncbi:hypothetical protein AM593_02395, partial [Mytilus galloprovincialis]
MLHDERKTVVRQTINDVRASYEIRYSLDNLATVLRMSCDSREIVVRQSCDDCFIKMNFQESRQMSRDSLNRASAGGPYTMQSGSVNNPQSAQNFQESRPISRDSLHRASAGGPYTMQSGSVNNPQSVQ